MGKCFSCLRKKNQPKREITLAILGLDNAGKTTATKALIGESLEATPTVGFVSENFILDNYDIKIFDLGGSKKIRNIWKQYFVEVYGIIYVVDSSSPERIEETKNILKELLEHDKIGGKPILVLANKQDQSNAMDEVDICEQLTLEDLVNANKCPCRIETCSAIKGSGKKIDENIKTGLKWICATLDHNWNVYHPRVDDDMKEEAKRKQKEMSEKRERVRKIREEREKKEEEERMRLGIEKPASDEDDVLDGDPFKRVDVNTLNEKEKRMKEEKRRKKELELRMSGQDTNSNHIKKDDTEDSDGEIKSSRSLKYLGLQNGLLYNNNLNCENKPTYDSDQDSDIDITSGKTRRPTPRLPPLQKPLGTKFTSDEQPTGKKKRKKKKLKVLQENVEENYINEVDSHPSKYSAQSVSKIMVSTNDSRPDFANQKSYLSNVTPNKHVVIGKTLSMDNETEEELTPRSNKKKKKKVKVKGMQQSFDDFPTPRSLEAAETNFGSSLSYRVEDEENSTEIRKLKKKAYLKKNRTAPSDDELEMTETLRDSNIKDFSWTLASPKRDVLSSEEEPVSRNWGLAEDLGGTLDNTPSRKVGGRPNFDEDDDVLL